MSLLTLIVTLVIVGFVLWLVKNFVPMEPKIYQLLVVIVVVVLILWLLSAFGILPMLNTPIRTR